MSIIREAPEGFVALFNGNDLTGWKGLLAGPYNNPIERAKLTPEQLAEKQAEAEQKSSTKKPGKSVSKKKTGNKKATKQ